MPLDWEFATHTLGHPQQVLNYLSRYVQRVAISNERLLGLDEGVVRFAYRDRAQVRAALNLPTPPAAPLESVETFCQRVLGIDIHRCPACRIGRLRLIGTLAPQLAHRARPP